MRVDRSERDFIISFHSFVLSDSQGGRPVGQAGVARLFTNEVSFSTLITKTVLSVIFQMAMKSN